MSKTIISATIDSILGFSAGILSAQISIPISINGGIVETGIIQIKADQEFSVPLDVELDDALLYTEEVLGLSINEAGIYVLESQADIDAKLKADDEAIRKPVALTGNAGAPVAKEGFLDEAAAAGSSVAAEVDVNTKSTKVKPKMASPSRGQGCAYAEKSKPNF